MNVDKWISGCGCGRVVGWTLLCARRVLSFHEAMYWSQRCY